MDPTASSQKKDVPMEPILSEGIPPGLYPFQHDQNITEGSEFVDDAIRTKDQPLLETRVSQEQ
jgi:hypothetical protein